MGVWEYGSIIVHLIAMLVANDGSDSDIAVHKFKFKFKFIS